MKGELADSFEVVPEQRSLAALIGERAAADPDRIAVEDGERRFSYGALDAAAAAVTRRLRENGVSEEEPVVVCLPRSWEAVVSFVGVLRAGAAYVPISPNQPAIRKRMLVELAGCRVALTGPDHEHGLPEGMLRLDAASVMNAPEPEPLEYGAGGDRLAYVLFTSGSTGVPKGVEVTHRNLTNLVCSQADVVPTDADTVLHAVPLEFDVSGLELWGALVNGARLVIAPDGRPDPRALGRLIAGRGVSFMVISSGVLHELVRGALPALGGLRLACGVGDVLSPAAVRALGEAHPHVRVLNGYGPTEATILASSYEVPEPDDGPVPIGRALPGYQLYVLDEDREPVVPGTPGELWIGGAGIARGYRADPERTAERFTPDPWHGGSMYRTGDRVRAREDGELLFGGRIDRQVKIAGQRVEPGEVENALLVHPAVEAAAVVVSEAVPGHKRLIAYVVPVGSDAPGRAELGAFLEQRVPRYMVPATFVAVNELPLTDRGKIDRSALERPEPGSTTDHVAAVIAELLRIDAVGANENLFDLGGDSLLAISLLGTLRERFGVELDIGAVFDYPTAAALADRIELAPPAGGGRPRLEAGRRERTHPLGFSQRRAWLFAQMNPGSLAYQFAALFRFRGVLDRAALAAALAELVSRHEILRTSFVEREGGPIGVIADGVPLPLEVLDLRGAGQAAEARAIRERVRTRIDPGQAPLVRWTLMRLRHDEWALVHVEHHLVHDGWSFAVLAGELSELYAARVERRGPALAEPSIQFQDYVRWERELGSSEAVAEQLRYWARTLDPDPPLFEFPADRRRGGRESFSGGSVRRRVEPDAVGALAAAGRAEGATLFMSAFAAFAALLHRHSGRDNLQVGSGVANRTERASRGVLGMIVNTIVLRVDLSGDPTVAEVLRRVRRVALEAYANADAPFDAVVEALRPPRRPSRSPLFNVLFSFHDSPRAGERWPGLETRLTQVLPNGTAKADLNIVGVDDKDGGVTFVWEHSDLFDDVTVDRIAEQHVALIGQFAARPDARLSELELLGEGDRPRLASWSGRERAARYERDATIAQVFEARVSESPDAVALSFGDEALTYGALDRRANRLAHHLRGRGAGVGTRVGVCLERSVDMVVAFLAIAKAGAAYVPLDPRDPQQRLQHQAAVSDMRFVVTLADLRERAPVSADRIVCLDELLDLAREPDAAPVSGAGPLDPAYVMFTTGSTGPPKGVLIPQRAIVRLVRGADYVRLGAGETMLGMAPPGFDASTFEIWGALLNGGRLALAPAGPLALAELEELVARERVTTMWLTAGLFHRVVDDRPGLLGSVRQVLAGGDVLSPDHVHRALAAIPSDGVLINGYGPTEATTFTCVHRMSPGEVVDGAVPIGRPVPGTTAHVVDGNAHEVPVGVEGELWIGGDGVALGYAGQDSERFLPDPFVARGRMYRSGDRARWRADGTLEFLGRVDRQLKIRGFRVEPGEIEEALRSHPGVADAHVTGFERVAGDRVLVAYVVSVNGAVPPAELRAHAARALPGFAVPSAWVAVESLPLNANGKVDAAALPAPSVDDGAGPTRSGRARRTRRTDHLERTLLGIWERVLDLDAVGLDDDFFDLGGHSLLAVELFNAIEDELGKNLPLATIFEAPTVAGLADVIRDDGWKGARRSLVPVKPSGSRPPLFCVCAGDGNATGFAALARRLPEDQPLYALQPRGLSGTAPLHRSVERAADHYVRQIRRRQRHGPYFLAGRCLGALVAYEMACRLEARGEKVGLVAVLDSAGPRWERSLADGTPFDEFMLAAVRRERPELDVFSVDGGAELLRWLGEPAGPEAPGVTRYLYEVYRQRGNLREAFPRLDGRDGEVFVGWAWVEGRAADGLCTRLLPEPPDWVTVPEPVRPTVADRLGLVRDRAGWRASELVDIVSFGRRAGAPGRQRRRVMSASTWANDRYRAAPYGGVITLIRSQEYRVHTMLDRWYALESGGVVEVEVAGSHRSMLREPDVASLAERLGELVDAGLEPAA